MRFVWIALLGLSLLVRVFVPFLRDQLGLGLDHDDIVEMFYNAAIMAWLGATLDLQMVSPALKKTISSSGTGLRDVETAVIGGLRLYVRF
jgi:porin